MAQTYLQLVNKVLIALREDGVLGLSEPYTKMVAQLVNDAKAEIEDACAWRALRTEIAFATVAATNSTTLTGTTDRSYILQDPMGREQVFRTDANQETRLCVVPMEALRAMRLSSNTTNNEPSHVAFTSDGTNLVAHFYPTPDAVYNYTGVFVVPQDDLVLETDLLTIPWRPVVRKAIFYAMDERGSEFAGRLETESAKARTALSDAMLADLGSEAMTMSEA